MTRSIFVTFEAMFGCHFYVLAKNNVSRGDRAKITELWPLYLPKRDSRGKGSDTARLVGEVMVEA